MPLDSHNLKVILQQNAHTQLRIFLWCSLPEIQWIASTVLIGIDSHCFRDIPIHVFDELLAITFKKTKETKLNPLKTDLYYY